MRFQNSRFPLQDRIVVIWPDYYRVTWFRCYGRTHKSVGSVRHESATATAPRPMRQLALGGAGPTSNSKPHQAPFMGHWAPILSDTRRAADSPAMVHERRLPDAGLSRTRSASWGRRRAIAPCRRDVLRADNLGNTRDCLSRGPLARRPSASLSRVRSPPIPITSRDLSQRRRRPRLTMAPVPA